MHRTDCSRRASEIRMGALRGCWAAGVPRGLGPARCITGPRRQECDSEPAGSLAGTAGIFRRATHATTAPSPRSVRRSAVAAARWAPRPRAMQEASGAARDPEAAGSRWVLGSVHRGEGRGWLELRCWSEDRAGVGSSVACVATAEALASGARYQSCGMPADGSP